MRLTPNSTITAALSFFLSLACTQQPAIGARLDPPVGSPVESVQSTDADSSTTKLEVTYIGPDLLQPLLTVTVQDQNGVRTVSGRDLSTFRDGDDYDPQLTLRIPVPDTIRARVQIRRAEDDTTAIVDFAFSGAVARESNYQIQIIALNWRPYGTNVIRVHAVPFRYPSVPGVGDSLYVVWGGYPRQSAWTFDIVADSGSSQSPAGSSRPHVDGSRAKGGRILIRRDGSE